MRCFLHCHWQYLGVIYGGSFFSFSGAVGGDVGGSAVGGTAGYFLGDFLARCSIFLFNRTKNAIHEFDKAVESEVSRQEKEFYNKMGG